MGGGREFLSATGPEHEFLNTTASPFLPAESAGIANFHMEVKAKTPDNGGATFGDVLRFKLPRQSSAIWHIDLVYEVSAITNQNVSNPVNPQTDTCFQDYLGYVSVKKVESRHSSNPLISFKGDDLFKYHQMHLNQDDAVAMDELVGGGLSDSERVFRAKTTQEIRVPLHFFWFNDSHQVLPTKLLQSEVEIDIELESLNKLIQNPTGAATSPTATIINPRLEMTYVHLPEQLQSEVAQRAASDTGVIYLAKEPVYAARYDIPDPGDVPSHTELRMPLTGLRGALDYIWFTIHRKQDIDGAVSRTATTLGTNVYDYTNFRELKRFKVTASQDDLIPWQTHHQNQYRENEKYTRGQSGTRVYTAHFNLAPGSTSDNYGSIHANALEDLSFEFELEKAGKNGRQSTILTAAASSGDPVLDLQDRNGNAFDVSTPGAEGSYISQQAPGGYVLATGMRNVHIRLKQGVLQKLFS